MANVVVYMKPDAQATGRQHEHNDVTLTVHEHYIRVAYNRSDIILNYPFSSVEKWEER